MPSGKSLACLAQSYELSEHIGMALDERKRQRLSNWPATIRTIPGCPNVQGRKRSQRVSFFVCSNCHQIVDKVSVVPNYRV